MGNGWKEDILIESIHHANQLSKQFTFIGNSKCCLLHTSARLLDAREITNLDTQFGLSCYKYTMQFGVPVFIMISGALFLNPSKEVGFGLFGRKYVKRIVSALVIFGLPMCLIETYFSKQGGGGN